MGSMGYGYGSECHLLRWMGRHLNAFNKAVLCSLGKKSGSLVWIDQLFDKRANWQDKELVGMEFLAEEDSSHLDAWQTWWPQNGNSHNWDAVGYWQDGEEKELVLVEAKAHKGEIRSSCGAKPGVGLTLIEEALQETALAVGATYNSKWLKPYYQYANRLAALHFLSKRDIEANLLLIYFIGDLQSSSRKSPQEPYDWAVDLQNQKAELGIPDKNPLSSRIHELFLHVSKEKAWLLPDSSSRIMLR